MKSKRQQVIEYLYNKYSLEQLKNIRETQNYDDVYSALEDVYPDKKKLRRYVRELIALLEDGKTPHFRKLSADYDNNNTNVIPDDPGMIKGNTNVIHDSKSFTEKQLKQIVQIVESAVKKQNTDINVHVVRGIKKKYSFSLSEKNMIEVQKIAKKLKVNNSEMMDIIIQNYLSRIKS